MMYGQYDGSVIVPLQTQGTEVIGTKHRGLATYEELRELLDSEILTERDLYLRTNIDGYCPSSDTNATIGHLYKMKRDVTHSITCYTIAIFVVYMVLWVAANIVDHRHKGIIDWTSFHSWIRIGICIIYIIMFIVLYCDKVTMNVWQFRDSYNQHTDIELDMLVQDGIHHVFNQCAVDDVEKAVLSREISISYWTLLWNDLYKEASCI